MKNTYIIAVLFGMLVCLIGNVAMAETKPIVIAVPVPLTGPYASDGIAIQNGIELTIEEHNANGGLVGRKLKAVYGDQAAMEADKSKSVCEKLLAQNPDFVLSGYDEGALEVFGETDIPYLHANATSVKTKPVAENLKKYGNVFHFAPTETGFADNALEVFVKRVPKMINWKAPNKKIAIITSEFYYSLDAAKDFENKAKAAGYQVVVNQVIPFGVPDFNPHLSKIENREPAFITFWHVDPADSARFMTQYRERFEDGIDSLLWMQYVPSMPEFGELTSKHSEGLLYGGFAVGVSEKSKAYAKRWKEKYKNPMPFYGSFIREGFEVWAAAVERAGCADCFHEVARQIREFSHHGMEPYVFIFSPHDQSAVTGEGLMTVQMMQLQKGQQFAIWPDHFSKTKIKKQPWLK